VLFLSRGFAVETAFHESPLGLQHAWSWQDEEDWLRVMKAYDKEPFERRRPEDSSTMAFVAIS